MKYVKKRQILYISNFYLKEIMKTDPIGDCPKMRDKGCRDVVKLVRVQPKINSGNDMRNRTTEVNIIVSHI